MTFDIHSLETGTLSEQGALMKIIHPRTRLPLYAEDGTAITLTIKGRNSQAFRTAQRELGEARIQRNARGVKATEDDLRRETEDILVACTVGWTFDQMAGEPFPCTPENKRRLWGDRKFQWLYDAAGAFMMDDGNFLAT